MFCSTRKSILVYNKALYVPFRSSIVKEYIRIMWVWAICTSVKSPLMLKGKCTLWSSLCFHLDNAVTGASLLVSDNVESHSAHATWLWGNECGWGLKEQMKVFRLLLFWNSLSLCFSNSLCLGHDLFLVVFI